jgi:hypothetical protein
VDDETTIPVEHQAQIIERSRDAKWVEIVDEGTDLAKYEAGDERIEWDEWIFSEVVSQACIDRGDAL